jgi:hypothetical protein
MLVMMIFLQVRIFKVPMRIMNIFLQMRIFKLVMRMMKNISQVVNFQSSEDDYAIGGHSLPSDKLKGNNLDVDFPPSEYFQDTNEDF